MTTDRRLVIDTNLWISRLLAPGGVAARAVDHGLAWGVPLVSQATLAELTDVLSRPRFDRWVTRAERQQFLRRLGGVVRMVAITQRIHACRDPKDDKFLALAVSCAAVVLVSSDHDLLDLHPFRGVAIMTPADFLEHRRR